MSTRKCTRIATLKTAVDFRGYLDQIGSDLAFDDALETGPDAPLARGYRLRSGFEVGNRFCVLPMEGWDGTPDGRPSALTIRRWRRFGESGAKFIWGGEAVAVRHDGRANPNQLMISGETVDDLASLRQALVAAHEARFGASEDLLVGLQLTHSGRFARPNEKARLEPRILYHHPLLDARFGIDSDAPVMTDEEIARLVEDFIRAAQLARQAGFAFVDVKHCHGYLGHEFLSAVDRPGRYGGSFANRTRFLREVVAGIRVTVPELSVGVRLSAFDFLPFRPGPDGTGQPEPWPYLPEPSRQPGSVRHASSATTTNSTGPATSFRADLYPYAFGGDGTGVGIELTEPRAFLDLLADLEIELVCITAGSPYYNPHIQRPALFPPSDGYLPPEDPLLGVARQIAVTGELKRHRPELAVVGSAYSYLQEWLPHVAQHVVRTGAADFVGLGRMVLPYPDIAADVLDGRPLDRRRICRTFSDCTTAPRKGLVSGCYPLDDFYKGRPEAEALAAAKNPTSRKL
jgi:2,4-dienoyl-CoA reductase-like NADH-dependent reductase (Old Yellow Enzyme family)